MRDLANLMRVVRGYTEGRGAISIDSDDWLWVGALASVFDRLLGKCVYCVIRRKRSVWRGSNPVVALLLVAVALRVVWMFFLDVYKWLSVRIRLPVQFGNEGMSTYDEIIIVLELLICFYSLCWCHIRSVTQAITQAQLLSGLDINEWMYLAQEMDCIHEGSTS